MSDVVIRPAMPADLPDLRLAMVELQEHERRLNATTRLPGEQIADAYLMRLQQEVAEKRGAIFIAERNGAFAGFAVGWIIERDHIPESADSNRFGYLSDRPRHGFLCSTRRGCAGAVLVRLNNGAVDHRVFVVGVSRQMVKEALPHAGLGPAAEPPVRVLPIAKALGQIAPRDPGAVPIHNRFDESAIVAGGCPSVPGLPRKQALDPLPLIIA